MSDVKVVEGEEPMDAFKVHKWHSECGGEFINLGHAYANARSTSWMHKCDKCGGEVWLDAGYPHIVYRPKVKA